MKKSKNISEVSKKNEIELSNLAIIILSTVGLIYTLIISNKPLTITTEFTKPQLFSTNDYYQISIPGNSTCNKPNELLNKCEIKINKPDIEGFVESLNEQKLYNIAATRNSGQIIISHLQGKRVELMKSISDEHSKTGINSINQYYSVVYYNSG